MKRFITLLTFTKMATAAGCKVNALYWTVGGYDGLVSFDAPDEETATALMVKLSSAGDVKTHTLQAFPREGIERILQKVSEL